MRKFSLFMLMAVGLLISASMSAMPERPVPPEPKAPEGVEMPGRPALPEKTFVKKTYNKIANKTPNKAPMGEETVVAKIGEVEYTSLQAAFDSAREASKQTVIEMIDDATESDELYIYGNSDVILNLNGKTITLDNGNSININFSEYDSDGYPILAESNDKLTINGGEGGKIIATGWNLYNLGTLIVNNVALENKNSGCVYNEGYAKFTNSSITTPEATSSWAFGIDNEEGVMEITNTDFNCPGSMGIAVYTCSAAEDQTATVTGGTINAGYVYNDGRLNITSSTITCDYIYSTTDAQVTNITQCVVYGVHDIEGGETKYKDCSIYDYVYHKNGTTTLTNCDILGEKGVYMAGYSKVIVENCKIKTVSYHGYYDKLTIKGSTTIDGNVEMNYANDTLVVQNGIIQGNVTTLFYGHSINISGGTIEGISIGDASSSNAMSVTGGTINGNININYYNNDLYLSNEGIITGDIIVSGDYTGYNNIVITGGEFLGNLDPQNANVRIKGGVFNHDYSKYVISGFLVKENDKWVYYPSAAEIVNTGDKYLTLAEAIEASKEGDIIKLTDNYNGDITIGSSHSGITFDVSAFTVNGTLIADGATIKVKGKGIINSFNEQNGGDIVIYRIKTLDSDVTNYIAPNCKVEEEKIDDDTYYKVIPLAANLSTTGKNYYSVNDALKDLPENSTPATVTLLEDDYIDYEGSNFTVNQYRNVTIDLNGYAIYGLTEISDRSAIFYVKRGGTLTINDSKGGGSIHNVATNPEDYKALGYKYPTKAYNLITNEGTVIINGGFLENSCPKAAASYVVDNNNNGGGSGPIPQLIVNGGHLYNPNTQAIRLNLNNTSKNHTNSVIINGGVIEGYNCIWVQLYEQGSDENKQNKISECPAVVTINGGTFKTTENQCVRTEDPVSIKEGSCSSNVSWNGWASDGSVKFIINGGTFDENFWMAKGVDFSITDGTFNGYVYCKEPTRSVTGGIFDFNGGWVYQEEGELHKDYIEQFNDFYVVEGYCMYHIGKNDADYIYEVKPCRQEEVVVSEGGTINLNDKVSDINETTDLTIVPTTEEGTQTIINITGNTTVNKIEVTNKDDEGNKKGEAQIVVGTGVVLNVGNGGIVSENDILTTVLVETGGTLVVGTGGVEQDGLATPIKIQTSEKDGTGTLVFNPNSQLDNTQNYAEVDLYTYCKKIGDGKYTWQQFAIPVTGLDNSKVVKTPNKTSYVFEWDYATYSWSQLSDWAQLDEPFAGYDITNISEDGGVVYTFKGDLIGNQNIQLTLPHKDYCVMGNSYTAPIDISALFDQINKEMDQSGDGTIEKTIYKYNAKSRYYEYINELGMILNNLGIADAPFTNIKPMEGFLLNLQNGNTAGVMLNYANAVYTPAMTPNTNQPTNAPRMNSNTDFVVAKINVSSTHATDLVTLVEGEEFSANIENGKDAFKYLNDGANLYAFDGTNKLAMVATDNLEGTMLAFQAAEDAEYTLTFDRALNTEYVLVDMMNGNEVAMTEGNTYTFFATPNTLDPARFVIKANAQAPTNMESTKATKVAKGIYTITGQYLGESNQWNAMPQGVYMVNGMKVIK